MTVTGQRAPRCGEDGSGSVRTGGDCRGLISRHRDAEYHPEHGTKIHASLVAVDTPNVQETPVPICLPYISSKIITASFNSSLLD